MAKLDEVWLDDAELQIMAEIDDLFQIFAKEIMGERIDGETETERQEQTIRIPWREEDEGDQAEEFAPQGQDRQPSQGRREQLVRGSGTDIQEPI